MLVADLALAVVAELDHEPYGVATARSMLKTEVIQPCHSDRTF